MAQYVGNITISDIRRNYRNGIRQESGVIKGKDMISDFEQERQKVAYIVG